MSVFQVNLNNTGQGLLDQVHQTTSVQRTIYAMGPGGVSRKLTDGEQFTDCNYWKRFAYPQVSLEDAIVDVVTDDGSVYSDLAVENTFPKVYDVTVDASSTYTLATNIVDILGDTGGHAVFAQITNTTVAASDKNVKVKLNGLADSIFDLASGDTQVFNAGELAITLIEFADNGSEEQTIQIVLSVRSLCAS
jgi:hypothetical protein